MGKLSEQKGQTKRCGNGQTVCLMLKTTNFSNDTERIYHLFPLFSNSNAQLKLI